MAALALGLRLLHVWYVVRALGTAQILDAAYYHDVALSLLGRATAPGLLGEVAFANVGYPYVLGWLYAFGPSPTHVLVFQALVGAATAALTGLVARDLFARERIGLAAAGIFALYAPSIFYDGLLLSPSLSAFLVALLGWSLYRALRLDSWRLCALSGLAIGIAASLRASQLLLLPCALVCILRLAGPTSRRRWWLLSALLFGTSACVAPSVLRQRIESGSWIPLTANGGMNFWIGNHRGASGGYASAPFLASANGGDFQHAIVVERDRFLAEAQRRSKNPALSLAAADRFWWRETGRAIAAAPADWLHALSQKVRLVANDYESRTNASFDFMQQISPLLRFDPLRFGVLAVLAGLGAAEASSPRERRARWLLLGLIAIPVLTCVVFFVSGEYRHAAAPPLAVLAALGLSRSKAIVETWSAERTLPAWRRHKSALLWLVVSLVLAFAPTKRLGPAQDRKAYAEALAMPSFDGSPPTLERYALARELLSRHGDTQEDRLLSTEALLLVESNQAIQFRDRAAAERLIRTSQSLWHEELRESSTLDAATIERIRKNSVRRVAQLCRQPFVQNWPLIQRELALLGCHSWNEIGTLLNRQRLTEAEAVLSRALALAPHAVEVLAYRGQLELLRGRDPTRWLERGLDGYPRLALPAALLAEYASVQGDAVRAGRYAREASRRDPSQRVASRVAPLLRAGRRDEAISLLQSAVRDGPYGEGLHYALGNLMLAHGSPRALVEFFSTEVARDQKPQTSHYFLALGFERLGQDERCLVELGRALDIDPAHELSQRLWGLVLERQGELAPALAHLVEATRIHPEYRAALEDAARVAARLGRDTEAEEWRARAQSANPDTPRRFLYWAKYLHEQGRDAAALSEVARRLAEDPLDAEALELEQAVCAALGLRAQNPR